MRSQKTRRVFVTRVTPYALSPFVPCRAGASGRQRRSPDLDQGWIVLALALFAAAFLFGAVFQSRAPILIQRAVDAGNSEEAARLLRRWAWGMRLILLLLVVITRDMVVKPTL
jgi:hypothetical protein